MAISKIQNGKVSQIDTMIKQFITVYEQSDVQDDLFLPELVGELKQLSTEMTAALTRGDAESVLEDKDNDRDGAAQGLYHLLKGATYHPDATIKNAAEAILKIFDIDMVRMAYGAESSMLDTLLENINSDKMRPLADSIPGAMPLITAVAETQKAFAEASVLYESEKGEIKSVAAPSAVKKKILAQFNKKIVIYLRAMEVVANDKYGSFCRTTAEMIATCNRA